MWKFRLIFTVIAVYKNKRTLNVLCRKGKSDKERINLSFHGAGCSENVFIQIVFIRELMLQKLVIYDSSFRF